MRDSKQLTKLAREEWFAYFKKEPRISYALARVFPNVIDRMNISKAANLAALRAFRKLATSKRRPSFAKATAGKQATRIFLDGGLYLGDGRARLAAKTVIKGDEKLTAVKIASIIAKVSRDRYMTRLAKRFPQYGFEVHKGYGTRAHYAALKKIGPSPLHRSTFL